jgi:hypothetical protein
MHCPNCGSNQPGQYCRACGTDLRPLRAALEKPDTITASAISARDEIGRAVADKIREMKSTKELSKVVEEILPQIAEFLETPEEKRLRRIRAGVLTAAIGLGAAAGFFGIGLATGKAGLLFPAGLGLTTFLIGLGLMINGWLFTVPQKHEQEQPAMPGSATDPLLTPTDSERKFSSSITEHTTHQLTDRPWRAREANRE